MAYVLEKDSSGLYCVCVFNADTASDEEINDVFGQFGQVLSMNRCNNLAFVRYATYEEASSCLEEMEGNSRFRVKPAKRKNTDKPDNQRNRDRVADNHRGAEMSNWKNGNNNSLPSTEKQFPTKTMPDLKFDEPELEGDAATIASELCHRVTMAHLPPDMLQCDIYNLCTNARASLLHVEMKSFTHYPYAPVHYAIVYVKSTSDVDNIVRGLNNLKVNGYQLVVAPYDTLVREGKMSLKNK